MSSAGRTPNHQPLKPTLASSRPPRSPIAPRVAANSTPTTRSEPSTLRVKVNTPQGPTKDATPDGNITPRSAVRKARTNSTNTPPAQTNSISSGVGTRHTVTTSNVTGDRNGAAGGLGIAGVQNRPKITRPRSLINGSGSASTGNAPVVHAHGFSNHTQSPSDESIDSHFFHASDALKQELPAKRPEPKKPPTFFYADGQQEQESHATVLPKPNSPVLSALSEQRTSGPRAPSEKVPNTSQHSPMLSPALSAVSSSSPFFAPSSRKRSPSPSKEHIHLSYRKGASQIFGMRPVPSPRSSNDMSHASGSQDHTGSVEHAPVAVSHRKSSSLSSIDSNISQRSRRKSIVATEMGPTSSPLAQEVKSSSTPRVAKPLGDLPTIDTSLGIPDPALAPPERSLSPSKGISELAAEARRERKVLDLEISNSSLMAINASLEREVRRQKTELKRFRRLSRAGRFSLAPDDRATRISDLSAVDEDDENEFGEFGPPSNLTDLYDEMSDDEESLASSGEPMSPAALSRRDSYRLARDEKRLQVDLEKHKELLVQSQMMNQSIKRCMYATEDMIREGKKALEYHVRVSDVKLGGRVLSNHEDQDDQEIEIEDDALQGDGMAQARGFLDIWGDVGKPSHDSSDRDSGIEVDRPGLASLPLGNQAGNADSGRPPGEKSETLVLP